jgi:hypothetical protein
MRSIKNIFLKYKFYIVGIFILLFISYVGSIAMVLGSDAYRVAKEFVLNSDEIQTVLGPIRDAGFTPKASIEYAGSRGEAYYYLNVATDTKVQKIYVELEKIDDTWEVKRYRILD